MKKWIVSMLAMAVMAVADEAKSVVFDLTTGNRATFEKKVLKGIVYNKSYYEGKLQELHVAVVIHGDAYKFFVKNPAVSPFNQDKELKSVHTAFAKRLATLAKMYDVTFLMCDAGRKKLKIDAKNLYPFVKLVATSTVGLIDKESEGYAYVPIH
jgi:intracellular sulfur oxidation DsrE/DsrF family protein